MLGGQYAKAASAIAELAEDAEHISPEGYKLLTEALEKIAASKAAIQEEGFAIAAKKDGALKNMRGTLNVPSQLDSESLNETPVSHPQMAKYDHSLDMNRWKGSDGEDAVVMEDPY
tara:strand:+ start:6777 stop:7124 length:348 start_codon:yes stop_codon:yes gene_type:complete